MATEKWLVDGPKTIDIEAIRSLKVGLVSGQVDIVGHDEPTARIEVHSVGGKDLKITLDGDHLEIDHPQLGWDNWLDVFKGFGRNYRADVSIMVPREIALTFGVVSAKALISGLTTDASISTVSGDIVVDGLIGDLQLNSVSGELAVSSHLGKITAHSVSGDIAATGEIFSFTADTVSGEIFLDLAGRPGIAKLNTVSGAITTRLPADYPVRYTINTVGGKLQLDHSSIQTSRGGYTGRSGDLDREWLDFKANTVSGNISVMHAVSA